MSSSTDFSLGRFLEAQEGTYPTALAELKRGKKETHWIWYVLPQLRGLGASRMSETYGISGLAEAVAYWAHPVLGPRLRECVEAMLGHPGLTAVDMLGAVDARKFQSCLTLFTRAAPEDTVFSRALAVFYAGQPDATTLDLLADAGDA